MSLLAHFVWATLCADLCSKLANCLTTGKPNRSSSRSSGSSNRTHTRLASPVNWLTHKHTSNTYAQPARGFVHVDKQLLFLLLLLLPASPPARSAAAYPSWILLFAYSPLHSTPLTHTQTGILPAISCCRFSSFASGWKRVKRDKPFMTIKT